MAYSRSDAVAYAHRWAFSRNPKFMNYDRFGGDCTNFISQCIHAGGAKDELHPDIWMVLHRWQ